MVRNANVMAGVYNEAKRLLPNVDWEAIDNRLRRVLGNELVDMVKTADGEAPSEDMPCAVEMLWEINDAGFEVDKLAFVDYAPDMKVYMDSAKDWQVEYLIRTLRTERD